MPDKRLTCEDCGQEVSLDEAWEAGPLRECDELGRASAGGEQGNRCPDCSKSALRTDDLACPHCKRGPTGGDLSEEEIRERTAEFVARDEHHH